MDPKVQYAVFVDAMPIEILHSSRPSLSAGLALSERRDAVMESIFLKLLHKLGAAVLPKLLPISFAPALKLGQDMAVGFAEKTG